jgi:hypothetical protein
LGLTDSAARCGPGHSHKTSISTLMSQKYQPRLCLSVAQPLAIARFSCNFLSGSRGAQAPIPGVLYPRSVGGTVKQAFLGNRVHGLRRNAYLYRHKRSLMR